MKNNLKKFEFLTKIHFFLFVSFITFIFFNFFDLFLFKASRSFHGSIFYFFENFIDPVSDLFDPLHIILVCLFIILINYSINISLKSPNKLKILKERTGFDENIIKTNFNFSSLICKHFITSLAIAGIFCNLIKYVLGVARPKYFFFGDYDRQNFFNLEQKVNSFPSGHTQAAFTLAILILMYINRYFIFILLVAFLMGISRIFMSMHFPSDIIFGAYLGSIIPILVFKLYFYKKFQEINDKYLLSFKDFLNLFYWRIFL